MTRKYQKEKYNNRYENEKKDKISEKAGGVKKEKFHMLQALIKWNYQII